MTCQTKYNSKKARDPTETGAKGRKIYRYINGEKIYHTISPKLGGRCRTNRNIYCTLDFNLTPHSPVLRALNCISQTATFRGWQFFIILLYLPHICACGYDKILAYTKKPEVKICTVHAKLPTTSLGSAQTIGALPALRVFTAFPTAFPTTHTCSLTTRPCFLTPLTKR